MEDKIAQAIAVETGISLKQIIDTIRLLDLLIIPSPLLPDTEEEVTGGLDEVQIRNIQELLTTYRNLEKRKEDVCIRIIEEQGKLTPELKEQILSAQPLQKVEDLYLP